MKKLVTGILAAALLATPALAADKIVEGFVVTEHRNAVNAFLTEKGIGMGNVERVAIEPEAAPKGEVNAILAFVHLKQCGDDGYLVVRMNRQARITQTYTRNDCRVAGVDNYR